MGGLGGNDNYKKLTKNYNPQLSALSLMLQPLNPQNTISCKKGEIPELGFEEFISLTAMMMSLVMKLQNWADLEIGVKGMLYIMHYSLHCN